MNDYSVKKMLNYKKGWFYQEISSVVADESPFSGYLINAMSAACPVFFERNGL